MFVGSAWKKQVTASIQEIEQQLVDLKRADQDLRNQNSRLLQIIKNVGRKLVTRLPISLESLDKGLDYDLIFPEEVATWRASVADGILLDTRSRLDYAKASIAGSYNIPLDQLAARWESLSKDHAILLICENGIKSVAACELLNSKGFHFLYVLKGGMSLYRGATVSEEAAPFVSETSPQDFSPSESL